MRNNQDVSELLNVMEPKEMSENLTDFWESWITHEDNDLAPAKERAQKWHFYKKLLSFINNMED